MEPTDKYLVVIAGPTAVGKTELTINLALQFDTEIISCDSRQFYRELSIGTAKPTADELAQVKHHFINSHSVFETYDVGAFERDANELLTELFKRRNVVFMTGGSGLYIKAVCEGFDPMPQGNEEIRSALNTLSIEQLQEKVKKHDPDFFNHADIQNKQRLVRALEVYQVSGRTMSSFQQGDKKERPYKIIHIVLDRDRDELYTRINLRVDMMIEAGLFEEAKSYYDHKNLYALQTVGYKEIYGYMDGEYDREEAIRLLKQNTRRYAKRQLTWFRREKEATWFHPQDATSIHNFIQEKIED